jgi:hypothetical protein
MYRLYTPPLHYSDVTNVLTQYCSSVADIKSMTVHQHIYPIKFDLFRWSAKHILLVNLSISVYKSFRKWNLVQSTINCRRLTSHSNSSNTRGFTNFNSSKSFNFLMNFDRVPFSMMHFNKKCFVSSGSL